MEDKNNPMILPLVKLSLYPFRILSSEHRVYGLSLHDFIMHIFTIPLLPNRMSIDTLKVFSSRLPLNDIILKLSKMVRNISDPEQGIVLLGNLLAFAHKNISKMDNNVVC